MANSSEINMSPLLFISIGITNHTYGKVNAEAINPTPKIFAFVRVSFYKLTSKIKTAREPLLKTL